MDGQERLKEQLLQWRLNKSIPRFILIEGDEGSGRLTFAKLVMKQLNGTGVIVGNSIAEVREVIDNAYNVSETTFYIFRDCDDMSVAAKNSLLKVVEEPPNKAYFIMTIRNSANMLDTIKSRATQIKMDPYTENTLKNRSKSKVKLKYIHNIGLMEKYEDAEITKAERVVNKVIEGLKNKSGTNVLSACTELKEKETDEKVDCSLFMLVLVGNLDSSFATHSMLTHILEARTQMQKSSINKKACIETALVKIVKELKG